MKKSRIFMSFGALALVIAGVVATKANKKFLSIASTLFYLQASHYYTLAIPAGGACAANFNLQTSGASQALFAGYPLYYSPSTGSYLTAFF
jgi:hypothetical protein